MRAPKPEFVPARSGSLPPAVKDSHKVMCAKCGRHKVWLTPTMERFGMRPVCGGCAPRRGAQ